MKRCFTCGDAKSLEEFYRHPFMKDGHLNECKECFKAGVKENRARKIDYYRAYDRRRAHANKQRYS